MPSTDIFVKMNIPYGNAACCSTWSHGSAASPIAHALLLCEWLMRDDLACTAPAPAPRNPQARAGLPRVPSSSPHVPLLVQRESSP